MAKDDGFIGFRLTVDDEDIARAISASSNKSRRIKELIRLGILVEAERRTPKINKPHKEPIPWKDFPENTKECRKQTRSSVKDTLANNFD